MLWQFPKAKGERTNIGREPHGRDRRFRFRAFADGNRVRGSSRWMSGGRLMTLSIVGLKATPNQCQHDDHLSHASSNEEGVEATIS